MKKSSSDSNLKHIDKLSIIDKDNTKKKEPENKKLVTQLEVKITELKQEIDPEVIKQRENRVCSILRIPILITYHVNIFYYPNDYNEFSIEDLLSEIDSDGISPLFLYFLCQLGNVYIDEKGEKVLSYSDSIYNIIFELVDLKNSIEEKLNLIKSNSINIIWMENSFIDISNMSSLFTKINPYTNYEIIVIDDCSTDGTYEMLQKNKDIKLIKNKINSKAGASRNRGIEQAAGEYIIFLDAHVYNLGCRWWERYIWTGY